MPPLKSWELFSVKIISNARLATERILVVFLCNSFPLGDKKGKSLRVALLTLSEKHREQRKKVIGMNNSTKEVYCIEYYFYFIIF